MLQALAGGDALLVPAVWPLEVANALLVLARRGRLTEVERRMALLWLGQLEITVDRGSAAVAFGATSELAAVHRLSVYDASYLELAQRRQLMLGTRDARLRAAARSCGVALWP